MAESNCEICGPAYPGCHGPGCRNCHPNLHLTHPDTVFIESLGAAQVETSEILIVKDEPVEAEPQIHEHVPMINGVCACGDPKCSGPAMVRIFKPASDETVIHEIPVGAGAESNVVISASLSGDVMVIDLYSAYKPDAIADFLGGVADLIKEGVEET